jgi:alpha-methylacyl-CoA racemase
VAARKVLDARDAGIGAGWLDRHSLGVGQIGPRGQKPTVPLNVIGDFGGGGLLLAFGLVCALLAARTSGRGQVIDAAMMDGAASFLAMTMGLRAEGRWRDGPGESILSGASHFYDTYETLDGKFISIAPVEPAFRELLLQKLHLSSERYGRRLDFDTRRYDELLDTEWPTLKSELASLFRSRSRDEWCALLEGSDVCFAPVLSLAELTSHPHHVARQSFVDVGGVTQPAPAPRFSATVPDQPREPRVPNEDACTILAELGIGPAEAKALHDAGAFGDAPLDV